MPKNKKQKEAMKRRLKKNPGGIGIILKVSKCEKPGEKKDAPKNPLK